jgi:septal ring factor EnvC (AmiA/AmiB activator)
MAIINSVSNSTYTDNDLKRAAGIQQGQFQDAIQTMLEGVDAILDRRLQPIENRLDTLETDLKVVKTVLTETNRDLKDVQQDVKVLANRTERLEYFTDEVVEHGVRLDQLEQGAPA